MLADEDLLKCRTKCTSKVTRCKRFWQCQSAMKLDRKRNRLASCSTRTGGKWGLCFYVLATDACVRHISGLSPHWITEAADAWFLHETSDRMFHAHACTPPLVTLRIRPAIQHVSILSSEHASSILLGWSCLQSQHLAWS